jgi:hypothetical protein
MNGLETGNSQRIKKWWIFQSLGYREEEEEELKECGKVLLCCYL